MPSNPRRRSTKKEVERAALLKGKEIYVKNKFGWMRCEEDPGVPLHKLKLVDRNLGMSLEECERRMQLERERSERLGSEEGSRSKKQKKMPVREPTAVQDEPDFDDDMSSGEGVDEEEPAHRQQRFHDQWNENKEKMVDLYLKSLAGGRPSALETVPSVVECDCSGTTVPIRIYFMHGKIKASLS